jgi:soluble lytic murein transglycosylase-like protein
VRARSRIGGALLLWAASASASAAEPSYRRYTDPQGVVHVTPARPSGSAKGSVPGLQGSGEGALPDTAAAADPRVAGRARDAASEVAEALADERSRRYESTIRSAARLYQLPESLLRAVIHTESNYNPNAVSRTNAMGLTQLMPSTARFLGVTQPFEPRQNIYGGAKFLRLLANRFGGDMVLVLAGYFSGAGAVQKYGGVPPHAGVRGYVKAVLRRFYAYERELQRRDEASAGPSRSIAGIP